MVMNITKYILDISLICILKFSFKNLLRCSENKQRKEKTQTMKKKFILLFSLITLVGCSQFSNRKDQSQNIVFSSSIPQGRYDFTIVSLSYPQDYNNKIDFYKNFNRALSDLTGVQKSGLNLLITKEMNTDFTSLLTTGWFDKEILGMKIVEDLDENDINYLNSLNISTPTNAGNLQELLNRQYYLLLQLTLPKILL